MAAFSMQSPGNTNWFKVTLTAGKTYSFWMSGLDPETVIEIIPVAGAADVSTPVTPVAVSVGDALANFTADATGHYYAKLVDAYGRTGAFSLTANVVANSYTLADPGALTVGKTTSARMESAGDADWFKVNLTRGDTYAFKEKGLDVYTFVEVVPAAQVFTVSSLVKPTNLPAGSSIANFTDYQTGAYYVKVMDLFGRIGNYSLSASMVENSYTHDHPGTLTVGKSTNATMQSAGDKDWFKVSLVAGDTYAFKQTGLDPGTLISFTKAGLGTLASDLTATLVDPGATSAGSSIANFTCYQTAEYYVKVADPAGRTGAYSLSASRVSNEFNIVHPEALLVNESFSATLQSAGDSLWFKATLTKGDTYQFKVAGLDAETRITIVPAADATNDPNLLRPVVMPTGSLSANLTADATGAYDIEVVDSSGRTGVYSLGLSRVMDNDTLAHPGQLAVGQTRDFHMQHAGDTDWIKINLTAGDTYAFKEKGLSIETSVTVVSLADAVDVAHQLQSVAAPTGSSTANFTADKTGAYYIEVEDAFGQTGLYSLSARQAANSYTLSHPGALTV